MLTTTTTRERGKEGGKVKNGNWGRKRKENRVNTARENESVSVDPLRVLGVGVDEAREEHVSHIGGAERESGVTRVRGLDGVVGQPSDGVGALVVQSVERHRYHGSIKKREARRINLKEK